MLDISNDERLKGFPTADEFSYYVGAIHLIQYLKTVMMSSRCNGCGIKVSFDAIYDLLSHDPSSNKILLVAKEFFESKGYDYVLNFEDGLLEINWR